MTTEYPFYDISLSTTVSFLVPAQVHLELQSRLGGLLNLIRNSLVFKDLFGNLN